MFQPVYLLTENEQDMIMETGNTQSVERNVFFSNKNSLEKKSIEK
jgi:hypothetical protein